MFKTLFPVRRAIEIINLRILDYQDHLDPSPKKGPTVSHFLPIFNPLLQDSDNFPLNSRFHRTLPRVSNDFSKNDRIILEKFISSNRERGEERRGSFLAGPISEGEFTATPGEKERKDF